MTLSELRQRIEQRSTKLGVVGLGYVGLPVACVFAEAGFDVVGVDVKEARTAQINAGVSPIEGQEPGLAGLLEKVVTGGLFKATTAYERLQDCDVITINVETPVDGEHHPRYDALRSALRSLGPVLKSGALVIVESTLAPGTTDSLVIPQLEQASGKRAGQDFYVGHCPERVMPGKLLKNLRTLSRVCGGQTPEVAAAMIAFYRHVVQADLDPTDCVTAELVKTAENAYRDVNIAFANEVALICEAVGGDVWTVRELVNKSPGRAMLLPGAGVGGHCIPKDPWLLAYQAIEQGVPVRLIPAARAVNDGMPLHIVDLLTAALADTGKGIAGSRILVLGYAYLEDSDDTRNSPSATLVAKLNELGAEVVVHDPYIAGYQGDVYAMADGCDAAVVMVNHRVYREMNWETLYLRLAGKILVNGRHLVNAPATATVGRAPQDRFRT